MNVACLIVPRFLVALARREDPSLEGRPVVVGGSPDEHASVKACSIEAEREGVVVGMALRRALALCTDAAFLPFNETLANEEAAKLSTLIERQSPLVEVIEQGHIHFDVRGLGALVGLDDEGYLRDLYEAARSTTRLNVRFAGAETVFAAHAAAACASDGKAILVTPGQDKAFLAPLPVEVLPVPAEMHQKLCLFGLDTVGQVAKLSFTSAQAQFGPDGARAWKLAHGEDSSTLLPPRKETSVTESLEMPAPAATSEPILIGLRELIQRALNRPSVRGYSLRQLNFTLGLESGEEVHRKLTFRDPTNHTERIFFTCQAKIERLELSSAAISLSVTLSGFCSEYGHQGNLWQTGPKRLRELRDAIAQLNTRVGDTQIFRIVEVEPWSRIPERQLALLAFDL
jgi:nucleotidyltransferase/DNA polymerase involved in DNA repair